MIFVVRYCTTPAGQYDEVTKLVNFDGDDSLFFTKEMSMNVHLQSGQRYWLPDGEHPFFAGGSIGEGFNSYIIEESGHITLNGKGLPYCVISETDWFSQFDSDGKWDESEIKGMTLDQLWQKHVAEQFEYHRKSFARFGWKEEEKLPPA